MFEFTIENYRIHAKTLKARVLIAIIASLALCGLLIAGSANAQPASFSSETGILEIPAIDIDGKRVIRSVDLQLQDTDVPVFSLVDYTLPGDKALQELLLEFGDSVSLDNSRILHFIAVLAESRCPLDVLCITSGEVTVILRITETLDSGNTTRTDFGLTLGGLSISTHYDNGTWYRLAEANPYPVVSTVEVTEEDYSIRVEYSAVPFKD